MNIRAHLLLGPAVLVASVAPSVSCGRPAPWAQTGPAPAAVQVEQTTGTRVALRARTSAELVAFPLEEGAFSIMNLQGDEIAGTYAGTSVVSGPEQTSSLTLQVLTGSGAFAGASGTILASGVGAFAGEGEFNLDGSGEVLLAGGKRAVLMVNLRGRSVAACSPDERIAISQTASGAMGRAGRVSATFTHAVGNTGCTS